MHIIMYIYHVYLFMVKILDPILINPISWICIFVSAGSAKVARPRRRGRDEEGGAVCAGQGLTAGKVTSMQKIHGEPLRNFTKRYLDSEQFDDE